MLMDNTESKFTLEGLKPDPDNRELTFTRFFEMADTYPNAVAISYLGLKVTFKKLAADINRFAAALSGLGVGHGDSEDHNAVLIENSTRSNCCLNISPS